MSEKMYTVILRSNSEKASKDWKIDFAMQVCFVFGRTYVSNEVDPVEISNILRPLFSNNIAYTKCVLSEEF